MQIINKSFLIIWIMSEINRDDYAILAEYNTVMEAEMTKSLLESGGIEARIEDEYMSSLYPTGVIPARLLVHNDDLQRARQLVANP